MIRIPYKLRREAIALLHSLDSPDGMIFDEFEQEMSCFSQFEAPLLNLLTSVEF
ncbi:hypothetical protein H6F88_06105 [Oculatella sp. FACHB-28]|uniref:hypothetical protein n=1 Tax=Cyanophyceae TaxID=3028117 RepID=UPI001681C411|nr:MULTISPECIES: hypothetical protein [Cyanophyceae]MBD2055597.1 hypothetical protein [Oculatella sp. FACHB-28]MBD2069965.1 hypothetical protein [Leptolyngbya sp. FACHB-671]